MAIQSLRICLSLKQAQAGKANLTKCYENNSAVPTRRQIKILKEIMEMNKTAMTFLKAHKHDL